MTIEEKLREIMLSEGLSGAEKLDQLHALIPPDASKIDNLNQATPAQHKQIKRRFSN
jgi:DNA polymerase III delta prime subunit